MSKQGQLRIIGGTLRGRKIDFPPIQAIRPSSDRLRETLFNWLQDNIIGAHCLDLFAGSGALGFEAISRGAASVTFVDQSAEIVRHLKTICHKLSISNASLLRDSYPSVSFDKKFDVIFLDPPFGKGLVDETLRWVIENDLLTENGVIFWESDCRLDRIPEGLEVYRDKKYGRVCFGLLQRNSR